VKIYRTVYELRNVINYFPGGTRFYSDEGGPFILLSRVGNPKKDASFVDLTEGVLMTVENVKYPVELSVNQPFHVQEFLEKTGYYEERV
jgi:hypothetical protein